MRAAEKSSRLVQSTFLLKDANERQGNECLKDQIQSGFDSLTLNNLFGGRYSSTLPSSIVSLDPIEIIHFHGFYNRVEGGDHNAFNLSTDRNGREDHMVASIPANFSFGEKRRRGMHGVIMGLDNAPSMYR